MLGEINLLIIRLVLVVSALWLAQANLFASQLYSELALKENRDNIIISPLAVRSVLAMLFIAAEGQTRADLKRVLRLHGETKFLSVAEFRKNVNIESKAMELKIAYRIFLDSKYPIEENFQATAEYFLNSTAESVDFENTKEVAKVINKFLEEKTNKKFKDAVQPADISSYTTLFLANGFYFKSKWAKPFKKIGLQRPFYFTPVAHVPVVMYGKTDELLYGDIPHLSAKGVEIPYKDSNLSMLIILPNHRTDKLKHWENLLLRMDYRTLNAKFQRTNVHIQMPRFKISYETGLNSVLQSMGLKRLYINPDFTSMTRKMGLRLSNLKHKGIIEVNSKTDDGSEYSDNELNMNQLPKDFIVDHQFIFIVKDPVRLYFMGRVLKPQ
ncbi:serine protease inhibitor 42Dd-like [Scaptodrosophila lebanonensis]|uniref:Serine protease inhibitor 42Dd-like n=1 Tax=Drosophila lebanonensis TaxID=7225 RepID=A0A6J2THU4_DROLE|nr:serine protease inhibitor 42Dd-like [Scaptodrosophila lebanonensis]